MRKCVLPVLAALLFVGAVLFLSGEALTEEAAPAEVKKEVLRLRNRGEDLSTEEVKSMLTSRKFYATCWNYNGF